MREPICGGGSDTYVFALASRNSNPVEGQKGGSAVCADWLCGVGGHQQEGPQSVKAPWKGGCQPPPGPHTQRYRPRRGLRSSGPATPTVLFGKLFGFFVRDVPLRFQVRLVAYKDDHLHAGQTKGVKQAPDEGERTPNRPRTDPGRAWKLRCPRPPLRGMQSPTQPPPPLSPL